MKKAILFLLVSFCFYNCAEKKKSLHFETLSKAAFNSTPFEMPQDQVPASLKRSHDSCMGFTFDANAIFAKTKERYFIGTIVNRQSLKTVNTLNDLGITMSELISDFNIISKPCYEKRDLQLPLKLILGETFTLQFDKIDQALNKEINDAISASGASQMETGSWIYFDIKDALKAVLDSTQNPKLLLYRNHLLDTSNMVLTSAESVADVSFIITTKQDLSEPLQTFLRSKPFASPIDPQVSLQLNHLTRNKFQLSLNGFFPVLGQFSKAELK